MIATAPTEDLDLLHSSLGHWARQLLDVQKTRVQANNRVAAMERDELPEMMIAPARDILNGLERLEHDLNRSLERSVRRHFMADWIVAQRGIGLPGFARLLGITGPLDNFATVSKLWAYLGMHVVDGAAPKRARGERANWSPAGRVLCHQLAESIVKIGAGGPYRAAYDRKKAEYLERDRIGPSDCPFGREHRDANKKIIPCGLAHAHNAAMRYAVKLLLREMWVEWHRRRPLHN